MRKLTLILPIVVAAALAAGWARARLGAQAEGLPSFTPARPPSFEPLAPPLGDTGLEGRVLNPAGGPVPEASVYLRAWGVPSWAYTDGEGRFRIDHLPAEELDLVVLAWPHPIARFRATPGAPPVDLTLPEIPPPPTSLPDLPSSPLTGRVLGAGAAWADPSGYEVVFRPIEPESALHATVELRVRTNAVGEFELPELTHGTYTVQVLPDWARGGTWPDLTAEWSRHLDHHEPRDPFEVELSAGAIEGRLWGDPSLKPIEGAFCLVVDAEELGRIWPPVVTTEEGHFRVRTLPPGDYLLSARAGEGALVDVPVEVRHGQVTRPDLEPLRVRGN